jgi:hypothetical protein
VQPLGEESKTGFGDGSGEHGHRSRLRQFMREIGKRDLANGKAMSVIARAMNVITRCCDANVITPAFRYDFASLRPEKAHKCALDLAPRSGVLTVCGLRNA